MFTLTTRITIADSHKLLIPVRRIAIYAAFAALFLLSLTTSAQDDAAAMRSTIEAQLEAFRAGDAQRAFSLASDQIRDKFGTPEDFIDMVRSHYAVVMAPVSVVFLKPERVNDATLQPVQMSDEHGQLWLALYSMQLDAGGSWRINGCALRRLQGNST